MQLWCAFLAPECILLYIIVYYSSVFRDKQETHEQRLVTDRQTNSQTDITFIANTALA